MLWDQAMFLFNPLAAAAIGAALENDRKIKDLQRREIGPELRLNAPASPEVLAALRSRLADNQERLNQLESDRRLDELRSIQIQQHEEVLMRIELESKVKTYSSQFISEGFTPIEADTLARDEIFYEQELNAVSGIAKDLIGQLNLPKADGNDYLLITKASRDWEANEDLEQILKLYPSDEIELGIAHLLSAITSARKPKFNTELLENVTNDCYKIICDTLVTCFQEWHQHLLTQTRTIISWYSNGLKKKQLSLEYLMSFNDEFTKRIKPKVDLLHQIIKTAELANNLNQDSKFHPITDMGAWRILDTTSETKITSENVMDFLSCALAGSEDHFDAVKNFVQLVKGEESSYLGYVLCCVKFSNSDGILLALVTNTENTQLKHALELFMQGKLTVQESCQIVNLTSHEERLLATFAEMKLQTDDAVETVQLFNLLSNLSDKENFRHISMKVESQIKILLQKEYPLISRLIIEQLQMNLDSISLKILLQTEYPDVIKSTLLKFKNPNEILDGDIAWLLAETCKANGQPDTALIYTNRALQLQSLEAYLALARVAIQKKDTSKLKVLNSFANSLKKDKRASEIEGAKFFLKGMENLNSGQEVQAEQDFESAKNLGIQQAKRQLEILKERSQRKSTRRSKWFFNTS